MKQIRLVLISSAALFLGVAIGHTGPDMKPYTGSKEFEAIKKLAGHWEATSTDMSPDKKPMTVTTDLKVTSGGSAVVETLFAGTPHEMVSVYHDENGHLAMTHYCMMQNQPKMTLKGSTGSEISLEAGKDSGVKPEECHMHALTIQTPAANQLVEKWVSFDGGKVKETSTFNFTRKG